MLQVDPSTPTAVNTPVTDIHPGTALQPTGIAISRSPMYPTTSFQAAGRNGLPHLQRFKRCGGRPALITFGR